MKKHTLMPSERAKPSTSSHFIGGQMAGLYDLEETLGKGHFAVVKAARHVFTGERVAVKVIDKTKLDTVSQKALLKEVLCMKLVQHPNVVRLYEVIDTTTKTYLVLELGQGDLFDLILKHPDGLSEDLARRYFCQIVAAVSYCHKLRVAHRDLKPENVVFFSNDQRVKLTDFGFSNRFCPGVKMDTSCGSLAYSAPEILLGDAYDAPAVDVWSLGVILYMLVCGRPPFQEANDSETLTMIMDVKYSIPQHVSADCRDLIKRMLIRYPEKRATLEDIENDQWLAQGGYLENQLQLPLISDHRVTNEEKNSIVDQMVSGQIASKEEILEHLQKGTFSYVTSTFFLLAEKLLRDRERNKDDKGGTSTALTASLESLHDRRKNSGQSDTEDPLSGEEDSLAPLDLDMKNSPAVAAATGCQGGKKSVRNTPMHQALSSTGLSELDKALPVLEEDATPHSEEEDSAGPLPQQVGHVMRRRAHYNHRRVIVPQRSTSCSSSEDEDSEKKKRSLPPHRHKTKSGARCSGDALESSVVRKSGDSSDDQSGGCAGNSRGGQGCSSSGILKTAQSFSQEGGDEAEGEDEGDDEDDVEPQDSNINNTEETSNEVTVPNENLSTPSGLEIPIVTTTLLSSRDWRVCCEDRQRFEEQYLRNGRISMSKSVPGGEKNFLGSAISLGNGVPSEYNMNHTTDFGNDNINTCALLMKTTSELEDSCTELEDNQPFKNGMTESSTPANGLSLAKKGKKLLMNWLFMKRRKRTTTTAPSNGKCNGTNGIPSSSGIYKTRSCAELKLRNGVNNLKTIDVNQNM